MRFRPAAAAAVTGAILSVALLPGNAQQTPPATPPTSVLETLTWRSVGPDRGGRSIAVSGVKGRSQEAYFGARRGAGYLPGAADGGRTATDAASRRAPSSAAFGKRSRSEGAVRSRDPDPRQGERSERGGDRYQEGQGSCCGADRQVIGRSTEVCRRHADEKPDGGRGEHLPDANQSGQDPLNFPIKINNRIASLNRVVNNGDGKPIGAAYQIFKEVSAELKVQTDRLAQVLAKDLAAFNAEAKRAGVEPVAPPR